MYLIRLNIFKLLIYIKEELLIVLGTSSSESALPGLIEKMENVGCSKPVVGLVIPTGYSFNLDGTSIYLTMAAIFIAQATNTPMSLQQQVTLLVVLTITSKGAAGVTGSGFITHNLRALDWHGASATPAWAKDFDAWTANALERNDTRLRDEPKRRSRHDGTFRASRVLHDTVPAAIDNSLEA